METPDTAKAEAGLLATLRFCERCKASIPDAEFRDGHALHMGNRHVHVDCLLKRSAALPVTALLLGLIGVGLGAYALTQAKGPGKASQAVTSEDVARQARAAATDATARIENELVAMKRDVTELSATRNSVAALEERVRTGRDGLDRKSQETAAAVDALGARLGKLEQSLSALSGLGGLDAKFNALSQAVADLRKDVTKLKSAGPTPPPEQPPPQPPPEEQPPK